MYLRRKPKYQAKKTVIDGYHFDSLVESRYYKFLKRTGYVLGTDYKMQVPFVLYDEPKRAFMAKKPVKRKYIADFAFYENGELVRVVDTKGYKVLPMSNMKMDMFSIKYKIPVYIARWNSKTKRFTEELR